MKVIFKEKLEKPKKEECQENLVSLFTLQNENSKILSGMVFKSYINSFTENKNS